MTALAKRRKMNVHFTLKGIFILEMIQLNFSDIQMLWYHQMPKHETPYLNIKQGKQFTEGSKQYW